MSSESKVLRTLRERGWPEPDLQERVNGVGNHYYQAAAGQSGPWGERAYVVVSHPDRDRALLMLLAACDSADGLPSVAFGSSWEETA